MKVIGINGSPHAEGNTYQAMRMVFEELEKEGIETEIVNIGAGPYRGCCGCGACRKNGNGHCVFGEDDGVNAIVDKIKEADGILLGSPVHYGNISGAMKCVCDRIFYAANGTDIFLHKVAAGLAAVRRSGGIPAVDTLHKYLSYSQMMVATSNYWPVIHGRLPGEVHQDEEGCVIMHTLGKNMAWLLKMREAGLPDAPEDVVKPLTNFIR